MKNDLVNQEMRITLRELAREIDKMTSEEKLLFLGQINQAASSGGISCISAMVAKSMLFSEKIANHILSDERLCFKDDISYLASLEVESL